MVGKEGLQKLTIRMWIVVALILTEQQGQCIRHFPIFMNIDREQSVLQSAYLTLQAQSYRPPLCLSNDHAYMYMYIYLLCETERHVSGSYCTGN